jgi:beta-lactamase class D
MRPSTGGPDLRRLAAGIGLVILFLGLHLTPVRGSEERRDPEIYNRRFIRNGVRGTLALKRMNGDKPFCLQPPLCGQGFLPASTFKIFNALVGLETGVIDDENHVIEWDGVERRIAGWNEDQDLETAMSRSTVPWFQEMARRIGAERMQHFLDLVGYGNADMSGGIDQFWLRGGLRISPDEQIAFLARLYRGDLPFSERTMRIVKRILLRQIGWLVGWVERDDDVGFFATLILTDDPDFDMWNQRKKIARGLLEDFELISPTK